MTGIYVGLAVWVVCMIAGAMMGAMRGHAAYGFLWPFILGPLGLLLTYALLKEPSGDAETSG